MLQEESCKRLAKLLHNSYSKAHIREFASSVGLNLDQQMRVNQIGLEIGVKDVNNLNM